MNNDDDLIKQLRSQIKAARATAAQLTQSREASCTLTKLDEAALWLDSVPGGFGPKNLTLAE